LSEIGIKGIFTPTSQAGSPGQFQSHNSAENLAVEAHGKISPVSTGSVFTGTLFPPKMSKNPATFFVWKINLVTQAYY
jgi:hypothetical protein